MSFPMNDIEAVTPEFAINEFGIFVSKDDISKPGMYHLFIGSRNRVEDIEMVESVEIPTIDELCKENDDPEWREYLEEFYFLEKDLAKNCVTFAYTEEECDLYFKIK